MAMQIRKSHCAFLSSNLSNCLLGLLTRRLHQLPKANTGRLELMLLSAKHLTFPTQAHTQSEAIICNFTFLSKLSQFGCFMCPATAKLLPIDSDRSFTELHFQPCH